MLSKRIPKLPLSHPACRHQKGPYEAILLDSKARHPAQGLLTSVPGLGDPVVTDLENCPTVHVYKAQVVSIYIWNGTLST